MAYDYLESAKAQFEYYKLLGEKAMKQMPDEALFWQPNAESNSVAIIVQHLHGNMLSRWTDFLTTDGEKEWRTRDAEFEPNIDTRDKVMQLWDAGWKCLYDALDQLKDEDLGKTVYIRNMGCTVIDAINRQMPHYAYHVGQIVFIAKIVSAENWVALTIPKGASQTYNSKKFSEPKHMERYTDKFLKDKK